MNDETVSGTTAPTGGERVGFCQDCGKPLTAETVKQVGTGVFCEPCLAARVGAPGTRPVGAAGLPPSPLSGAPSPAIAAILGIIPGVGAMYNGQYAKGLAHFVITAILMSLSDGHSIFGLLCAGWYLYQIFDAYHTAKARLEGLPLPNPFGLNDIGERMGFGKGWPGSAGHGSGQGAGSAWSAPGPGGSAAPGQPGPASATPGWVGYVPPTQFATSPPVVAAEPAAGVSGSPYTAPYTQPYAQPYTAPVAQPYAQPVAAPTYVPTVEPAIPAAVPRKRVPAGAFWLIGLGLLFTLANVDSHFRVSGHWIAPALLAGLAVWLVVHRLAWIRMAPSAGAVVTALRWPIWLAVLAVLLVLQAADLFTLGQTWPVLLVALGGLLLLERSLGFVAPPLDATRNDDATKGGL